MTSDKIFDSDKIFFCNLFFVSTSLFFAAIIIWNFGIGGMLSIYWKAPLILQQVTGLRINRYLP